MGKKVKGSFKIWAGSGTSRTGYQELWNSGRVHYKKMKSKIRGINKPSV